jgi:hypothetical protein
MKKLLLIIILNISMLYSQNFNHKLDSIINDLDELVQIDLPNSNYYYSKVQSKTILIRFFNDKKIINYTKVHNGVSMNNSFDIYLLQTKETKYRLIIFYCKFKIKEIIIELY